MNIPQPWADCLLFQFSGAHSPKSYGFICRDGTTVLAHREAWERANGPIPAGMIVCHKCDVRACVNPDHLFLGTHADNAADRKAKGRNATKKGEANGQAKLTEAQARAILWDKRPQKYIAADFGVSITTVSRIKRAQKWPHLQP